MFNFIECEDLSFQVSEEYVEKLERDWGIIFPDILKEYYVYHNGAEIKECRFEKYGLEFCVVLVTPLKYGTIPLEKMWAYVEKNPAIPNTYFPIALDEDDDYYYWDSQSGKVYYISLGNVEHPKEVFGSVEEFFEVLNESC